MTGTALMLGAVSILVGSFFVNSLYLQAVIGDSALETGLAFLPIAVAIAFGAHVATHVLSHAGSHVVAVVGLLLMSGAAVLLAVSPDRASYASDLLSGFVVLGLGVGMVLLAVSVTSMSRVDHVTASLASGLMMTAHQIGAALGVAVLAAIAAAGGAAGYEDAFVTASVIAFALGLAALVVVPVVRPAPSSRVPLH